MGDRIKATLALRGLSQAELARLAGVKQQTISYIVNTEAAAGSSRYTTKIAEVLGVNPGWLLTGDGSQLDPTVPVQMDGKLVKVSKVPVISAADVQAHLDGRNVEARGVLMVEDAASSFALEIEGESMSPKFTQGDHVIIRTDLAPEPGDYVAALYEGAVMFRRFRARNKGFELVPENADWATTQQSDEIAIIGTMVEHRTYRKR